MKVVNNVEMALPMVYSFHVLLIKIFIRKILQKVNVTIPHYVTETICGNGTSSGMFILCILK